MMTSRPAANGPDPDGHARRTASHR